MKICPSCKKTFEDDQVYCAVCGTQLADMDRTVPSQPVSPQPVPPQPVPRQPVSGQTPVFQPGPSRQAAPQPVQPVPAKRGFVSAIPLIISAVGMLVAWESSALLGGILGLAACIMVGTKKGTGTYVAPWAAVVFGVIAVILWIFVLIVS